MAGGRKTLPLFELIGDSNQDRRREPLRTIVPQQSVPGRGTAPNFSSLEAKPLPDIAADIRGDAPAPTPPRSLQPIVLSRNVVLVGIGVLFAIGVLAWTLGVSFGGRQKEREVAENFGVTSTPLKPPTPTETIGQTPSVPTANKAAPSGTSRSQASVSPIDPTAAAKQPPSSPPPSSIPAQAAPAGSTGRVMTIRGLVEADPRQSGWNYLVLGLLPREDCWAAIQFLAQNGVETFAVQVDAVDRRLPRANTSARFQLFAAKGVPSRQFASTQVERDKLKRDVARIGAIWKKDHKGSASFSDAFWLKN